MGREGPGFISLGGVCNDNRHAFILVRLFHVLCTEQPRHTIQGRPLVARAPPWIPEANISPGAEAGG